MIEPCPTLSCRRPPLRWRLARLALLLASLLGLAGGLLHASRLLDAWLAGGPPAADKDGRLRQTILLTLADAAARGEIDRRIRDELRPDEGGAGDEAVARALLLLAMADRLGLAVSAESRALVEAETTPLRQGLRLARQCGRGFVSGEGLAPVALGCAAGADLLLWGDLRDLGREAWRGLTGAPIDPVLAGLAGAGLGLTALTYATAGTGVPVRAGVTTAKLVARSGKTGLKGTPDLLELVRLGSAATPIRALKLARNGAELQLTTRIARVMGKDTDAVLELLGRRAYGLVRAGRLGWKKVLEVSVLAGWLLASAGGVGLSLAGSLGRRSLKRLVHARLTVPPA